MWRIDSDFVYVSTSDVRLKNHVAKEAVFKEPIKKIQILFIFAVICFWYDNFYNKLNNYEKSSCCIHYCFVCFES